MTDFDPARALREEISVLSDIHTSLLRREKATEQRLSEAEIELNALRRLRGFADIELERKKEVLRKLENESKANK